MRVSFLVSIVCVAALTTTYQSSSTPLLCSSKSRINACNIFGSSHRKVHSASGRGDIFKKLMTVKSLGNLLKEKNNSNTQEYGELGHQLLSKAVAEDDLNFAEFLLKEKVNPNRNGRFGCTPVIFLAKSVVMANLLEQYGADLKIVNGAGYSKGMDLLHHSIHTGTENDDLYYYYLSCGFSPEGILKNGNTLWHSLVAGCLALGPMNLDETKCSVQGVVPSESRFLNRARILHSHRLSPYRRNNSNKNAVELLQNALQKRKNLERYGYFSSVKKLETFLDCMEHEEKHRENIKGGPFF